MALVLFELPGRTASSAPRSNGPGGSTSCSRSDISGRRDAAHYPLAGGGRRRICAALLDRREPLIFLFSKFSIAPIDGARAVRATGSNRFVGAAIERAGGLYAVLSLRHFGPAAICSLSLGGGGRRRICAALLDRREPLIFLFSKFSIAPIDGARAVRATGSNRFVGAAIERAGGLYVVLSLRHFGPAAICSLSLGGWWAPPNLRGAARSARAADFPI